MLPKPCTFELVPMGEPPIKMNKEDLRSLIEVITGHDLLKKHLKHWHNMQDQECTLCRESPETYHHIVHECPALTQHRIENPCDFKEGHGVYYGQLLTFIRKPNIKKLRKNDIT